MSETWVNAETLGKLWGVDRSVVYDYAKREIIPKPVDGKWEPVPATVAYCKHLRDIVSARGDKSLTEIRKEILTKDNAKKQIELELLQGKVVEVEKVRDVISAVFMAFRAKLLAMPSRLAPILITKKKVQTVRSVLKRATDECLSELSTTQGINRVLFGVAKTTARPNAKRVGRSKKNTKRKE
jgi:hypothetical protein